MAKKMCVDHSFQKPLIYSTTVYFKIKFFPTWSCIKNFAIFLYIACTLHIRAHLIYILHHSLTGSTVHVCEINEGCVKL